MIPFGGASSPILGLHSTQTFQRTCGDEHADKQEVSFLHLHACLTDWIGTTAGCDADNSVGESEIFQLLSGRRRHAVR